MPLRATSIIEICLGPVPVFAKLYSVASERTASLSQVHAHCGGRLEQQYVCVEDGAVVPRLATAKEYRLPDERVATLVDEDLKAAESERVGTLEIVECVPEGSIDPTHLGKTMFVGPNEEHGIDAYSTLVDALAETRTIAVGVLYTPKRDQLVVLERYRDRGLLLREVFYASEMRPIDQIELPRSERATLMPGAFEAWTAAIERCRKDAYSPEAHQDGYPERLLRVAERRAAGAAAEGARSLVRAARAKAAKVATGVVSATPPGRTGSAGKKRRSGESEAEP